MTYSSLTLGATCRGLLEDVDGIDGNGRRAADGDAARDTSAGDPGAEFAVLEGDVLKNVAFATGDFEDVALEDEGLESEGFEGGGFVSGVSTVDAAGPFAS